jgi:hypothetical protein
MSDAIKPNFMRYQRVADVVASEPALKARLGPKSETVLKPNGDKVEFPKEVIDLTERIHAAGHDANALNKQQLLKLAVDVILRGENGDLPPVPARNGSDGEDELPVPKRKKKTSNKPKKEHAQKETSVKAAADTLPEAEAEAPEKPVTPRKARVAAGDGKPSNTISVASPPVQSQNSVVPFAVGCAVNSNLIGASQLLEIHDRTAEGKDIRERLDKIIEEVQRRTIIPNNVQARS